MTSACKSPYADFDRRMVAEWQEKLWEAAFAGVDAKTYWFVCGELRNYQKMLKQSLAACPCKGRCAAVTDSEKQ